MTKRELLETEQRVFDIYSGILVNHLEFRPGPREVPVYDFDCPEYETLREKYGLVKLAGKGTAFQRAKRLPHHFAPRLTHSSFYDNHLPCDALSLLELRERFARRQFAAFVTTTDRKSDLQKLRDRHMWYNTYYCKNLFWLGLERWSTGAACCPAGGCPRRRWASRRSCSGPLWHGSRPSRRSPAMTSPS